MRQQISFLVSMLAAASQAQTFSSCNPLTAKNCPSDPALSTASFTTNFQGSKSIPDGWEFSAPQGAVNYDGNGANFVVGKQGDSPTIQTNFYVLFGSFEVTMKAASGQGIVSSIVMESDDLDEVDWEFTGTNTGQVQSNYFGKGDTSSYDRAAWHGVGNPQGTTHTFKVDWTPSAITWYIDGAVVRTLNYNDAQGGARFPQTPMRLRLGIWAGGDPTNGEGTVQWAGGPTDFSKVPFTMTVQKVTIVNYSPAKSYSFKDNTGSYKNINIDGGALMSGTAAVAAATSSKASMTTSLSIASGVPTLPPAAQVNGTKTNGSTLSTSGAGGSPKPTGSTNSTQQSSKNAAAGLESSITAFSTMALTCVAFGMALFM